MSSQKCTYMGMGSEFKRVRFFCILIFYRAFKSAQPLKERKYIMKTYFSFIIIFLFSTLSICFAGNDSLYVEVKNDTLFIWNVNVWEQCAFSLDYEIDIIDSTITITEEDTAFDATTCYCYHNFYFPIVGIEEGNYHVDVYRKSWHQELCYINSLDFILNYSSISDNALIQPDDFILYNAYPNPFNPITTFEYFTRIKSEVRINIYNILGKHIVNLQYGNVNPGFHKVIFDASNLPSGLYFYTLETEKMTISKKVILLK